MYLCILASSGRLCGGWTFGPLTMCAGCCAANCFCHMNSWDRACTQLYVVGGNGGNAAANAIHKQCERDGVLCSVIGVPKSIDNDIQLIDKCGHDHHGLTSTQISQKTN